MSQIQVTDEISIRLTSLRAELTANNNFNKAQQLTFENSNFPALTAYSNSIQKLGNLGELYKAAFERDITAFEKVVENIRASDKQAGSAIKASINKKI